MTDPQSAGASGTSIRVVVADDQAAIREALAALLDLFDDIDVVGTASDGAEAVTVAGELEPDVVLMDLRMPGTDGISATSQLSERQPSVAVVVLTTFADEESILAALTAGARGYLTKDSGRADIARAVRAAAAGQAVLDRVVQDRLLAAMQSKPIVPDQSGKQAAEQPAGLPVELTPREREVLALIGQGLSNRAIAQQLFVSEATVKTHINNLFAKAQLRDRAEAVRYAFQHGIVE